MNRTVEALIAAIAALEAFKRYVLEARAIAIHDQVPNQYRDMMTFLLDRIPDMYDELHAISKGVTPQVDASTTYRLEAMKADTRRLMAITHPERSRILRHEDIDPELEDDRIEHAPRYLDNEAAIHY